MSKDMCFSLGALIGSIAGIIACSYTAPPHPDTVRQEAIQHGAAEWTIDAKTGERAFRWKQPVAPVPQPQPVKP